MRLPSGENATDLTELVCPLNGPETTSPVSTFQTRIWLSEEPETIRFPSGENATEYTGPISPSNGPKIISPVSASQTRIVSSYEPETMRLESGENAADLTEWACPSNTFSIVGQLAGLSVRNDNVPVKMGENCCVIPDPGGANGKADM